MATFYNQIIIIFFPLFYTLMSYTKQCIIRKSLLIPPCAAHPYYYVGT